MNREEFISDLNVRPEVIGSPGVLSPLIQFVSSQRNLMFASNAGQMMVVDGCEVAKIQSGYESKIGKYEFDKSSRNQDVMIVAVIPKFRIHATQQIRNNPKLTVIYIGCDDGKVGYFDVDSYTELYSGFGYINKKMHLDQLQEGRVVDKDVKFITSPNHENGLYKMGVNAKVAYLPHWATTDDAFKISRTLQKKLAHTVVDSVVIDVRIDDIPLNLYGGPDEYKSFPDIGEQIREDGILIGFRKQNKNSFLMDMTDEKLRVAEDFHDDLYRGQSGAIVIDVEIFTNQKKYKELLSNTSYRQLMQYQEQYHNYWNEIVAVYEQMKREGREVTPSFNTLVTSCKGWCYDREGRSMILMNKKEPVDFIRLKITYAYQREIDKGYKLVGDAGNKGVVSEIAEDEDMPVMEDGTRADIMITGASPFNRLSSGQYYQAFINYASDVVMRNINMMSWDNIMQQYEYILDYINEIRPVYAKYVREKTKGYEEEYVEACKKHGIYLVIPPFTSSINEEMVLRVAKKYNIQRGKVTYAATDGKGNKKIIKTCTDALFGDLYIHLLGKIPIDQLNAIEFGYQSQFQVPIKPNSKTLKAQSMFGQTPIRYGEDETSILVMSCGAETALRILCTYSNSPVAIERLQRLLLTAQHPSAIWDIGMSTQEMIESASNIGIFKHQLAAVGFEIEEVEEEDDQSC